ncbi:MAG: sulfatase-like hydrolase/transferase [Bacteroidia bacterium]|nr:sulfatase-like hydrolase/transferase [Bacteroidia bacterium]
MKLNSIFLPLLAIASLQVTAQPEKPNILLIQVDDMGFDDLSCNGNTVSKTPNLDAFSKTAVRFGNFMVCNVCSPTRASLLTGRDFWRTGVSGMHGGNDFMNLDETTFANIFQKNGYTTGMWGKWHSGKADGYWPWERGFDEGYYANLYNYYPSNGYFNKYPELITHEGEWSPKVLVDYTIDFISRNQQKPFLAYCSFLTCHGIWNTPDSYRDKYMVKGRTKEFATLLGMLELWDNEVGRLLKYLTNSGLDKNTVVIFMSDNGPISQGIPLNEWELRNNHGFLGNKARNWQNGIKSPLYIRLPGTYKPVSVNRLVTVTDIFPTLLDIANIPLPAYNLPIDGRSIKPYLEGDTISLPEKRAIFAHWSPERGEDQFAPILPENIDKLDFNKQDISLVTENYKLLLNPGKTKGAPEEFQNAVLVDLKANPMETVNIAGKNPVIVNQMKQEMEDWFNAIKKESHPFARPVYKIAWKGKTSSEILAYGASKTFGVENEDHQIAGWDKAGDYAEYKMMVYQSGVYSISVKSKKANLKGITFIVSCDGNETISGKMNEKSSQIGHLQLSAGEHTLKLEIAAIEEATKSGAIDLQSLQLDLDDDFMGLSDPKATNETVALFSNLKKIGREGIIFGHHFACYEAQNWKDSNISTNLKSDCFTSVGDHPGIIGFDLRRGITLFKAYSEEIFRRGGISTYSWHVDNPVTGGDYNDTSGAPVASILAGGIYLEVWEKKLDEVAGFFNSLEVNGVKVPVIFRPFHENTGSWFWWGAGNCTNQQYIDLWRLTVDYLRNEKGVHNMLLAYSPSKPSTSVILTHDMYPGDDYVDIIGFDAYQTDEALKPLVIDGARLVCEWAKTSHKVPAMTEIGIKNGIQNSTSNDWFMSGFLNLFKNDAAGKDIAYVLTWMNTSPTSYWVPLPGQPNYNSFVNFYNDPFTYFLNDLDSIYKEALLVVP